MREIKNIGRQFTDKDSEKSLNCAFDQGIRCNTECTACDIEVHIDGEHAKYKQVSCLRDSFIFGKIKVSPVE